jgi:hypothetical protein
MAPPFPDDPAPAEQAVVAGLADELREVLEQRAALDRRVDELWALIEQLERRHGVRPEGPDSVLAGLATTRVGAVESILLRSDGPLSLAEVEGALRDRGMPESRKAIASALSYLGTKNRAHRVGRGRWSTGPPPDDADPDGLDLDRPD